MRDNEHRPRIGVCHGPGAAANLREIYKAANGWCQVVLLVRDSVAGSAPELMELAGRLFECHRLADPDGGIRTVADLDLDAVTTFDDDEVELADRLDRVVRGLPADTGPSPWDKLVQRRRFSEAGIGTVTAIPIDSPDDLVHAFERLGGPGVLKPRRAAGGDGIAFLDDHADLRRQLTTRTRWSGLLLETRIAPHRHPADDPWLGDLVSVETVTVGARRIHLGVLDKLPVAVRRAAGPGGTDAVSVQGDILPSKLSAEQHRQAIARTDDALDLLAVGSRITHTELRITPDGFEVLEVNGRLAGHTSRLFRLLGGPDLVRVGLRAAVGLPPEADLASMRGAAAGLFPAFPVPTGIVRSVSDRKVLRAVPGVAAVDELAVCGADRADSAHRLANLTVCAADRAELDRAIQRVLDALAAMFDADVDGPADLALRRA